MTIHGHQFSLRGRSLCTAPNCLTEILGCLRQIHLARTTVTKRLYYACSQAVTHPSIPYKSNSKTLPSLPSKANPLILHAVHSYNLQSAHPGRRRRAIQHSCFITLSTGSEIGLKMTSTETYFFLKINFSGAEHLEPFVQA